MERSFPFNIGKIPAGTSIHRSSAEATPQINPAPALVARLAKNRPKANPKRPPSNTPCVSGIVRIALRRAPPAAPSPSPIRVSIQTWPATPLVTSALIEDSKVAMVKISYRRTSIADQWSGQYLGERKAPRSNPSAHEFFARYPEASISRCRAT